jgi:hypothetical protein
MMSVPVRSFPTCRWTLGVAAAALLALSASAAPARAQMPDDPPFYSELRLEQDTAVYSGPDAASAVVATLPAGSVVTLPVSGLAVIGVSGAFMVSSGGHVIVDMDGAAWLEVYGPDGSPVGWLPLSTVQRAGSRNPLNR